MKRCQSRCMQSQAWRAKPSVPKMVYLPPACLHFYKPPFYSTGVSVHSQSRLDGEQRHVGELFTSSRCVHLDLLESLDTNAFLMSLRRFISRRGKPFELLSNNGTIFTGGARELREAFKAMGSTEEAVGRTQIEFCFNPPSAPHFGRAWERK